MEAIPPRPVVKTPTPAPVVKQAPLRPLPQRKRKGGAEADHCRTAEDRGSKDPGWTVADRPARQAHHSSAAADPAAETGDGECGSAPPPPPQAPTQGKLLGGVALPNTSVDAAVHDLATNDGLASAASRWATLARTWRPGAGLNLPPSAGRPHSNLELRSDPMGVDFRPYMMQVLAAVRRNWFAVYPEAARLRAEGRGGARIRDRQTGSCDQGDLFDRVGREGAGSSPLLPLSALRIRCHRFPRDSKGTGLCCA